MSYKITFKIIMVENFPVSVIIPCNNVERYIERAVISILNQSHRALEVIIVNDGSSDNTEGIIRELQCRDNRIIVISLRNSIGIAGALNAGIELSHYEWIARMDGDDISLPNRLERQINFISKYPEVKLVGCLPYYINENDEIIGKMNLDTFTPKEFYKKISKGKLIFIPGGASMFHKETLLKLGGFSKNVEFLEDLEVNMRFAINGHLILNVPEYLYMYRKRELSIMSNTFSINKKMRWIKEQVRCSLKGLPLPTYEEYIEIERSLSLLNRVRILQDDYVALFFKKFGLYLCGKRFRWALFFLLISILIKPGYVFFKMKPTLCDILAKTKQRIKSWVLGEQ